ncbi:MAG: SCP2 sterol-binding domain-containing protein [Rubrivivax sp.]|nr:SCP2 sterol-binding domain-containing protein [Rubrivivax sp.]
MRLPVPRFPALPELPQRPALPALPAFLGTVASRGRSLVRRLPPQPPSWLAARLLDRLLLPRLSQAQRRALAGRVVELELLEPGLRFLLVLGEGGFAVADSGQAPAVVIRAQTPALWRLVRGEDDADRLFFDRALVMEGDTEFGLELKNTLDAIGPLWR